MDPLAASAAPAAPVAPVAPWVPEDDVLLKNAVEAGASLEALAKGAVRFSRSYSLRELQDRWHSLLYDVDIATQASACMLEIEGSASKENKMEHGKRKGETIRNQYYLMRKRLRAEFFASADLGLIAETSLPSYENGGPFHEHERLHNGLQGGTYMLGDCVLQDGDLDFLDIGDVHTGDAFHSEGQHSLDDGFASIILSDSDLANLSESLLCFSQDDEILPRTEEDRQELMDTSYDNSGPVDMIVSDPAGAHPETTISQLNAPMASSAYTTMSASHSTINELSTAGPASKYHELNQGHINCILNTEDPEIPSNDDIFLEIHSAIPDCTSTRKSMNVTDPVSSAIKDKAIQISGYKKGEVHPHCVIPTKMVGSCVLPAASTDHSLVCCSIKPEFLKPALPIAPRRAKKAIGGSTRRKSAPKISNRAESEKLDGGRQAENGMVNKLDETDKIPLHAEVAGATGTTPPEPIVKPSTDQEEPDSDNDVLHFSDIEAMILEQDLDLQEEDVFFSRLVSRYQNDDSKRKIIRLEQCAQSALQRTLACHGALAVVYGRHLKHFIKKTEVILGRPTAVTAVDIDLGKEGRANKISRKQAKIVLGSRGSFFLINQGKTPMFVNGKEVVMNQSLRLSASCLIQIRELSLVFETDPKTVRQYFDGVIKGREHAARGRSTTEFVKELGHPAHEGGALKKEP